MIIIVRIFTRGCCWWRGGGGSGWCRCGGGRCLVFLLLSRRRMFVVLFLSAIRKGRKSCRNQGRRGRGGGGRWRGNGGCRVRWSPSINVQSVVKRVMISKRREESRCCLPKRWGQDVVYWKFNFWESVVTVMTIVVMQAMIAIGGRGSPLGHLVRWRSWRSGRSRRCWPFHCHVLSSLIWGWDHQVNWRSRRRWRWWGGSRRRPHVSHLFSLSWKILKSLFLFFQLNFLSSLFPSNNSLIQQSLNIPLEKEEGGRKMKTHRQRSTLSFTKSKYHARERIAHRVYSSGFAASLSRREKLLPSRLPFRPFERERESLPNVSMKEKLAPARKETPKTCCRERPHKLKDSLGDFYLPASVCDGRREKIRAGERKRRRTLKTWLQGERTHLLGSRENAPCRISLSSSSLGPSHLSWAAREKSRPSSCPSLFMGAHLFPLSLRCLPDWLSMHKQQSYPHLNFPFFLSPDERLRLLSFFLSQKFALSQSYFIFAKERKRTETNTWRRRDSSLVQENEGERETDKKDAPLNNIMSSRKTHHQLGES